MAPLVIGLWELVGFNWNKISDQKNTWALGRFEPKSHLQLVLLLANWATVICWKILESLVNWFRTSVCFNRNTEQEIVSIEIIKRHREENCFNCNNLEDKEFQLRHSSIFITEQKNVSIEIIKRHTEENCFNWDTLLFYHATSKRDPLTITSL